MSSPPTSPRYLLRGYAQPTTIKSDKDPAEENPRLGRTLSGHFNKSSRTLSPEPRGRDKKEKKENKESKAEIAWDEDLSVVASGYLNVKFDDKGKWESRFFVLKERSLLFFKKPADSKPKGEVKLAEVSIGRTMKKENCFALHAGGRTYLIQSKNEQEKIQWIESIARCSKIHPELEDKLMEEIATPTVVTAWPPVEKTKSVSNLKLQAGISSSSSGPSRKNFLDRAGHATESPQTSISRTQPQLLSTVIQHVEPSIERMEQNCWLLSGLLAINVEMKPEPPKPQTDTDKFIQRVGLIDGKLQGIQEKLLLELSNPDSNVKLRTTALSPKSPPKEARQSVLVAPPRLSRRSMAPIDLPPPLDDESSDAPTTPSAHSNAPPEDDDSEEDLNRANDFYVRYYSQANLSKIRDRVVLPRRLFAQIIHHLTNSELEHILIDSQAEEEAEQILEPAPMDQDNDLPPSPPSSSFLQKMEEAHRASQSSKLLLSIDPSQGPMVIQRKNRKNRKSLQHQQAQQETKKNREHDADDEEDEKDQVKERKAREERAREEKVREDKAREEEAKERKVREEKMREEKAREEKEKAREEKARQAREEKVREERAREVREEKAREEKAREERAREDKAREDKAKEDKARLEKLREDKARIEKLREDKAVREEKAREEKAREDKAKEDKAKSDKAKEDKAREDKAREEKARADKAKADKAKEDKAKEDKAVDDLNDILNEIEFSGGHHSDVEPSQTKPERSTSPTPSSKAIAISPTSKAVIAATSPTAVRDVPYNLMPPAKQRPAVSPRLLQSTTTSNPLAISTEQIPILQVDTKAAPSTTPPTGGKQPMNRAARGNASLKNLPAPPTLPSALKSPPTTSSPSPQLPLSARAPYHSPSHSSGTE